MGRPGVSVSAIPILRNRNWKQVKNTRLELKLGKKHGIGIG
jgi:hypothetical protein